MRRAKLIGLSLIGAGVTLFTVTAIMLLAGSVQTDTYIVVDEVTTRLPGLGCSDWTKLKNVENGQVAYYPSEALDLSENCSMIEIDYKYSPKNQTACICAVREIK